IISHELRTPLTSISGALDLVLNFLAGDINEKQHPYLAMAKESTDKLNAIVDDLLDLSKFSKGKLKMSFELESVDELVKKSIDRYGPTLEEKQIRLAASLPEAPIRALVDPNRLNQVLHNLLTNAVKFTPEGGEIRLDLDLPRAFPGYLSLTIWNSGEAIPDTELERIFDKFEQARTARTRTVRGTGLGLAICRNIVEAHGGRIWAESSSEGARFAVVLPLDAAPTPETTGHVLKRGKVLIAEADRHTGLVAKAVLMAKEFDVSLVRRGDEAVTRARRMHPDVVVLDAKLPDVDGLRLVEIFRNDPETRHAPILSISGEDERARAFRFGASAFLLKPLAAETLVATLDGLAKGQAGRQQGRVLVVDDDPNICSICVEVLSNLGFEALTAGSLAQARDAINTGRPDVLLLDLALPDGDGFSFLEEIKAERASAHLPVIFISARTETSAKVRALKLGGDDYLTKPFDAIELGARVESVLRRKEQELGSSPTTQLPGSSAIEREVERRVRAGRPFAFCYLDLDNLKAYNDYYGFAKADGVVRQTGDLLREIIAQEGVRGDFLGHVAGDDFVFITDPSTVDPVCRRTIEVFDEIIPLYYDRQDRERGYIEAEDRFGERRRFPIMSVSVVAVMCDGTPQGQTELSKVAAELKKRAKAIVGSVYLRSDREVVVRSAG
ncbi:MAG: response regulator, partial [Myxococcaceae bacterium]